MGNVSCAVDMGGLSNLRKSDLLMYLQSVNIIPFNVSMRAAMKHTIKSVHKTPVFRQVNYVLINDNKLHNPELSKAC